MPLCADPSQTVEVTLETDSPADPAAVPDPARAVFLARFLTVAETRRVRELTAQAAAEKDGDREQELLDQILALQYAGWRNVRDRAGNPVDFVVRDGRLISADEVLGPIDKWELVRAAFPATVMSHLDKKKRWWLARSAMESSARTAATPENA